MKVSGSSSSTVRVCACTCVYVCVFVYACVCERANMRERVVCDWSGEYSEYCNVCMYVGLEIHLHVHLHEYNSTKESLAEC